MNREIKVVVIGCGYWGKNYVRLLSQFPGVELVGVCDQSQDRLDETANLFPGVQLAKDIDVFLEKDGFDAAVICTNPVSHHAIAARLLDAGKHVLVEKPIATLSSDAKDMVERAKIKNVVLMVGHIFLFNTGVEEVKSYIDAGSIGQIYYLYARRTNLGPIRPDVNAVWDLAPHDIAIFNHFMNGSPDWVSGVGANFIRNDCADAGFIILNYPNGVIANIHVSWADPHKVREVVVIGSEQRVVFNDISPQEKVTIYKKGVAASSMPYLNFMAYQFSLRDGDIVHPCLNVTEPLRNQLEHFFQCVRDGQRPITDGQSGLEVIKVLEAVDASMKLNGAPVKII